MEIRKILLAGLFLSGHGLAQSYDPNKGQSFDAYGRPLASVEQLCREGQMAGGPITEKCAMHGYYFNKHGEQLISYDFTKWGYNRLDRTVTKEMAAKLDTDSKFRAEYIKLHNIQPSGKTSVKANDDVNGMRQGTQYQLNPKNHYIMRCQQYLDATAQKNAANEIALAKNGQSTLVNNGTCTILDSAQSKFSMTVIDRSGLMTQATLNFPDNAAVHSIGYFFTSDLIPTP